jgi:hypothetical protein
VGLRELSPKPFWRARPFWCVEVRSVLGRMIVGKSKRAQLVEIKFVLAKCF